MSRMRILVLAAALAAAFQASDGRAAEADKTPARPKEAAAPAPAPAEAPGGLTVFVDPDTKKIRPPEQGEVELLLRDQARRPAAGVRVLTNVPPGGGVGLALDSSFEMFLVATKQPDGKVATACVTGHADAPSAASAPAAAPKAKPKEAPDAR